MTFEEQMAEALETFVVEAADMLAEIETGLLRLEQGRTDDECVNSLFRAVHTIKGSSGLFGLDDVVRFAHVVESVLDRVRDREVPVTPHLIGALLPCKDHLADLLAQVPAPATGPQLQSGETLLAALQPFLEPVGDVPPAETSAGADTGAGGPDQVADDVRPVHLSLRFGVDSLRSGMDPLPFVRYLGGYGELVRVTPVLAAAPAMADLDPEACHLGLEVCLLTGATPEELCEVFDFVAADSDIRLLSAASPVHESVDLVLSYGDAAAAVRDCLVASGVVDATALDDLLPPGWSGPTAGAGDATGGPVPAPRQAPPDPAASEDPAPDRHVPAVAAAPAPATQEQRTIRVDAGRLDRLIDAVGELVIAGSGASLLSSLSGDEGLQTSVGEVMRLVEEVRDGALQLRMVPIGTTFGRFQRVVRDVSASLGKDVRLVVSGGDTEVDKALVEQIADPLTHLVRNALDHGIEPVATRLARGKPATGTLRLNAFHDSGSIVIEVQDDGGGIDPERVLAKAVQRGIVPAGAVLSEQETFDLVFSPGFSTAEQVSDLSGRGVGMDVVKRNVTSLRGTIDVESRPGEGTTMRLRLPLTLAIIDGFLVGVGDATYVVPLDQVVECVELPRDLRRDYMDLRGEVLPFVRLRELFGLASEPPPRENVVVVEHAGVRTGLVVDALKGGFQTVIKPLGRMFDGVPGIGGSTILGNGDVALIVDVPVLVRRLTEPVAPQGGPG